LTDRFAPVAFPVITDAALTRRAASADVRGHAAGYAAGLRAAQVETDALRARMDAEHEARLAALDAVVGERVAVLDRAAAALQARVAPVLAAAEESVASAAVDLAEAVLGAAIRASRPDGDDAVATGRRAASAEETLRRALATAASPVVTAVRLSPADAAVLDGLAMPVPVVADPALRVGDAVVDLPDGLLDARIDAALDRARAALGGVR
jgi:flagellar assembly protein FliH